MPTTRTSRVYTISLPPELAQKAEALAKRDSRTMSELFREAFRAYYAQDVSRTLDEIGEYAATQNPGYTEADVPRLIQEVRDEVRAERRAIEARDKDIRRKEVRGAKSPRRLSRTHP
jgi:CopG family transcriptional regulator/antitoxin EndoAI